MWKALQRSVNKQLRPQIAIRSIARVADSDFDARFSAAVAPLPLHRC